MKFGAILLALALSTSFHVNALPKCDTCPRDKNGHIQRSAGAKTQFKRAHPCPSTLKPRGACPGFVIDHIIALKRGGPDLPGNMQWQTVAEGRIKDKWE